MKKLLVGFALIASIVPASVAFAAAPTEEQRLASCTERVANIPTFLESLAARHTDNATRLQSGIDRLTAFIATAQGEGTDTGALEANLASLIYYQADIETDHAALVNQISANESFVCSADTLDEWRAIRETTKTHFDALKTDAAAVKALREDIKTNIQTVMSTLSAE